MSRINVCLRIRPFFPNELSSSPCLSITSKPHSLSLLHPSHSHARSFLFDHIFDEMVRQEEIYDKVGRVIVGRVLEGYNGTVLAYGQTNSGKSFTMGFLGDLGEENDGLVQRCIKDVFRRTGVGASTDNSNKLHSDKNKPTADDDDATEEESISNGRDPNEDQDTSTRNEEQQQVEISMDFVQIYLEKIQDLLNPSDSNLLVRETRDGRVSVPNLTRVRVHSVEEALHLLKQGLDNRIMAPTLMNTTSSRSHTILSVHVKRKTSDRIVESTLRICDLAGSERITRSGSSGLRLDEAKCINKSLSTLGVVISSLAKKKSKKHIPFRDSKLTRLLKPVLGTGNSNTVLIATVSPTHWSYSETLSTLQFGQRCMHVETHAVLNEKEEIDYKAMALRLQKQVRELQAQQYLTDSSPSNAARENGITDLTQEDENDEAKVPSQTATIIPTYDDVVREAQKRQNEQTEEENHNRLGWGMCNALHDSLHKLYEVSRSSLQEASDRSRHMEDLWTPKNHIDENTNLNNPHLRRVAIVNEAMNQIRTEHSMALPFVNLSKRPIQKKYHNECSIEEYANQVANLFHSTYTYVDQLHTILKKRDEQVENLKRELAKHVVDEINFAINGGVAGENTTPTAAAENAEEPAADSG